MADTSDLVTLERRDDGVAVLTLNNPKVNALSGAVLRALRDRVAELEADLPGAVVVTGGDRIFAAGAEISEFGGPDEARSYGGLFLETFNRLAALERMTIAAIAGYALGGGCELALACDLRVASEGAKLGQPEILLGIIPGGGGTQRLARLVGPAKAKELICGGAQVRAPEALAMGLVDHVVPADELQARAIELAAGFAKGAVVAQGLAKRAIDQGLDGSLGAGLDLEQDLFVEVFRTEDAGIGVASFLEHGPGKASFVGR
ncbi:MAG: enoyl-CoA hydratase/isomerase family protein [Acidimicrobiales bacterium]|nr:enoyl-CoA hydratase/isomerase family protein [Acidimicrobiales bacterium]MCB1260035.1 enoyl-CoA hydratase/isomerase family protein [Acidimicrobiales bacterium]